jgi:hypothetical protein
MIKNVNEYLVLLKKELSGSDPAVIQDALVDCEEYLRIELANTIDADPNMSEADALPAIIEKYGSPVEIAAAYRDIEERVPAGIHRPLHLAHRSALSRFFGVFADPRAWGALLYLILSLGTGIIYFTWAVTGISLSLGLMVLIIGIPFTALFLLSIKGIAYLEGRLVEALLGVRMPRKLQFPGSNLGWWKRIKSLFSERGIWTSMLYSILQLPLGIFYFTLFVTLISVSLYFIAMPITQSVFNVPIIEINDTKYHAATWLLPFIFLTGIMLITATMHLAKLLGRSHAKIAKAMLVTDAHPSKQLKSIDTLK